ncbi:MAG: HAMP domain-containing histidine kinase [Rhodocyclaceae bacterium]|nr:HAMP domain-containing histidine kinase [Rhodocyclaceae bacterium]
MPSPSFRQSLLLAFLLIAAVLTAAAMQGLAVLEDFASRSRGAAGDALRLSRVVQLLGERAVDMSRSARQYRLLGEPALYERFAASRAEAIGAIDGLGSMVAIDLGPILPSLDDWRASASRVEALLTNAGDEDALFAELNGLAATGGVISGAAREAIEAHNRGLFDALDANRARVASQVSAAVLVSVVLAVAFGAWLVRSLSRLEKAIVALGDGYSDRPVHVAGPRDLRQVGERVEWLRERLNELESDRVRVLRHVSHELKTPLAAMREGVSLLEDRVLGPLVEPQREVVAILKHNCATLQTRIEALLGVNAAAFDARRLSYGRIEPVALLRSVVEEQALQIQQRRLEVSVEGHADVIEADKQKVALMLSNLLANAIAFSPEGSLIRLIANRNGKRLRLDCIDEGPGVEAEDAQRIFDPFFRGSLQPEGRENGTGIGLSIVREYAHAHGGSVVLVPASLGCHFRIELPYER